MTASLADDMEVEHEIVSVEKLQDHGIDKKDIERLAAASYHTVRSVQMAMSKHLLKIKGFSEIKVEKIKDAVKKCFTSGCGFSTAAEMLEARKVCFRISTGSKRWDESLLGGFQSGSLNEVFGEFRCGKTQLAHTLCVIAQLPKESGGGEGRVAYIDTEGTFRPERLQKIAERFGVDPDTALENVNCARAWNSEHQCELVTQLCESFATGEYRLLIIDSICAHWRVDYQGRGELQERQSKLGHHLNKLKAVAEEFNIVVFYTNQVQSDPGAMFQGADGRKAIGGHVLAHASTTRILLRKGRGDERVAKVLDSPDCKEIEATYVITDGGINDADKV